MVAGPTHDAIGDRFVYRQLGLLQVKGQTVGVPVYELLGRPGEVNGEKLAFGETFDRGCQAYMRRDWATAWSAFERCLETRPGDPGASRYLTAIHRFRDQPPSDEWNGTLELTEK